MTIQYYYIAEIEGCDKGPFLASEILALSKQGLISPTATIRNGRGETFAPQDFENMPLEQGGSPSRGLFYPPPLYVPADEGEVAATTPILSRRFWFVAVAIGLLRLWWYYRTKPAKSSSPSMFQGLRPPAISKVRSYER